MQYTPFERELIVVDSFGELNYNNKKNFLASLAGSEGERQKFAQSLIKTLGGGVYNKLKAKFSDGGYRDKLFASLERRGVFCVTIASADYPESLKNIPVPPLVLYCRGNRALLGGEKLTVVGSRKTLPQIVEQCRHICSELTRRLTIVTGVADGADSAAIKGALASGRIICVLPGGHDSGCAAHAQLLARAEEVGLSISEYPPAFKAQRYTFLVRNRIMAGLSSGTLVVSAAKRSGALSTASYAADYGRDVFAFPYFAGVPSGEGCNALIKKGAYLAENALDILSVFGLELPVEKLPELSEAEQAVFLAVRQTGEMHAAEIAKISGRPMREVAALCAALEIKGLITRTGGNKFAAVQTTINQR